MLYYWSSKYASSLKRGHSFTELKKRKLLRFTYISDILIIITPRGPLFGVKRPFTSFSIRCDQEPSKKTIEAFNNFQVIEIHLMPKSREAREHHLKEQGRVELFNWLQFFRTGVARENYSEGLKHAE